MKNMLMAGLLLMSVLVVLTSLTGCSSGKTYGVASPGLTKEQINQRHLETMQIDRWQIQDDIDAIFLFERPGRRSRMMLR